MQRGAHCIPAAGPPLHCKSRCMAARDHCSAGLVASLQLAPVAHQPLLHGHTGALQSGTRCIPAAVAAVTHCTIKCCCMGAWWCLIVGLVAFQQLLHTKSCCMDAQCHCSTAPAAPQYPLQHSTHCIPVPLAPQHPLHPSTNSSQCSLHPNTHCTQHPLHPKSCCTDGCCQCSTYCIWHPLHGHVVAVHQQPLHPTA